MSCTKSQSSDIQKNQQIINKNNIKTVKESVQRFDDSILYSYSQSKELSIATQKRYATLDPHNIQSHDVLQVIHALYTGLTTLNPITGKHRPALAEYWESSLQDKGYTYTFNLRNVKWTDGTALTAQQVQQSLLRAISPQRNTEFSFVFAHSIKGAKYLFELKDTIDDATLLSYSQKVAIQVIDPLTISITTQTMNVPLLQLLAHPQAAILPIEDFRDGYTMYDFSISPENWVGLGAYVPVQVEEDTLILQENKQFWVSPWSKRLVVTMGLSQDIQIEKINNKQLDWVKNFPYVSATNLIQSDNKNIHNQLFSSLVFFDIPETSIIHTKFVRKNLGLSPNTKLNLDINNLNTIYSERSIAEMLSILRNIVTLYNNNLSAIEITSPVQVANSLFKPYYISTVSINTLSFISQLPNTLQNYVSQTLPYNTDIDSETIDLLQFQKNRSYIHLLRRYLEQNKNNDTSDTTINIAYDYDILRGITEYLAQEYFETNGISTNIKQIKTLNNSGTEEVYDIAIRLFSPTVDEHYAMLLAFDYYFSNKNTNNNNLSKRVNFSDFSKTFFLLQDNISDMTKGIDSLFYTRLKERLNELQIKKRIVPIFFYAQQHYINVKKFSWWTIPTQLWHPLYP